MARVKCGHLLISNMCRWGEGEREGGREGERERELGVRVFDLRDGISVLYYDL